MVKPHLRHLTKTGTGNADGFACLNCNAGYDTAPPSDRCYQVTKDGQNCRGTVVEFARWVKAKGLDPLD